ncbi:MAG: tetratricopeptide repeat protein, partial [Alphaproteobacteria bacterium]
DQFKTLLADLKRDHSDNPDVIALDGSFALAEGRPKDAVPLFEKAMEQRPIGEYVVKLATAKWSSGDKDGAVATLTDWTQKSPDDLISLWKLGNYYQAQNRLDDAKKTFLTVIEKAPKNWAVQNDLAWVMLKMGDADGAQAHAEKAYDLAPKNPLVADTLGMVVLERGDQARAVRLLQEAADGAPARPDIKYHLAKAQAKNGNADEAKRILKDLLAADQPFAEREDAKALLQELGG